MGRMEEGSMKVRARQPDQGPLQQRVSNYLMRWTGNGVFPMCQELVLYYYCIHIAHQMKKVTFFTVLTGMGIV